MTSYLRAGWFERSPGKRGLRTEVIDGAMDVAGILVRAGIDGTTVLRLALRTRALMAIADPRMLGVPKFSDRERALVMNGLTRYADKAPELYAFVADCVERVDNLIDLMAFYLHLTHVARMIELLSVAVRTTPVLVGAASGDVVVRATGARRPARSAASKKAGGKDAGGKNAPAKKTGAERAGAKIAQAKKTGAERAGAKIAQAKKTGAKRAQARNAGLKNAEASTTRAKRAVAKNAIARRAGPKNAIAMASAASPIAKKKTAIPIAKKTDRGRTSRRR